MARSQFYPETERGEAFIQHANRNRVGRKHNHQPRGRARERQRQNLLKGKSIERAKLAKKMDRFKSMVAAYWRGDIDAYPQSPI